MTEKTIEILKSLKFGEKYPAHKPIGKQEIEEQGVLSKLYNLEILKRVKYSYSVRNVKYLSKFIELQDFEKLVEYIENPNESENGIKSSLEYKILKHLKVNDNGEYIDVSELSDDKKLLRTKLNGISKEKLISYSGGIDMRFGDGDNIKVDHIKAKIEFKGIEYLNKLETENKNITNNFNNSTISQLNQESNFSNSPTNINPTATQEKKSLIVKFWKLITENKLISGIILVIITEEITIGKIWKLIIDLF